MVHHLSSIQIFPGKHLHAIEGNVQVQLIKMTNELHLAIPVEVADIVQAVMAY